MSFYDILDQRNAFLGYKNNKFKKVGKLTFSKGVNPWFWSKNGPFCNFYFSAIQGRKMSFAIFYKEKTPVQAIKTKSLKSPKTNIFPKALAHSYCPKMANLPNFFFRQYRPGKCLLRYSTKKKNAFLGYKNKKFKKSKNRHFFKGVNQWFWSKNCLFSNFFFIAIQARKMSFTIFYIEKTPLQPIKRKVQKVEKLTFFQRG